MTDDGPPGVPEWIVTYGDMMSLLLTFFIMLVSLSEVVANNRYRAIMQSIQKYIGYDTAPIGPPGKNYSLNSLVEQMESKLGSFTDDDQGRGGVKSASVEGMDIRVLRTREGSLKHVGKPILFKPGQVDLTAEAKTQLRSAAQEVAGKPNKIEIPPHASLTPLPTDSPFSDKLELTYVRSRVIGEFLETCGIEHDRIRLIAASETEPLEKTGDQRQEHLDRGEILISDAFVSEYVGPRDIPD